LFRTAEKLIFFSFSFCLNIEKGGGGQRRVNIEEYLCEKEPKKKNVICADLAIT
jgi:hypothetical protein